MKKFKVTYYFEKELYVTEIVEAEIKEEVIGKIKDLAGFVELLGEDGNYFRFNLEDVKLTSIEEV